VGGVNDQSFNQSAWEGLQRLRDETGANVSYIESRDESNYAPNIETFMDQKVNLIWGVGFMLGDAIAQAGKDYPGQQFAIVDYAYSPDQVPNNNVTGVVFAAEECSFLVGYYAGALAANPDIEIMGQYSGSFGDPAAGKNIANQYFAAGADIIYHAAGGTGAGVIEAAREQDQWAIGVENYIAPNNVLTSALKWVDNALYDVSDMAGKGQLKGGTLFYNLKNNGVGYATTGNHIPASVITEVEAIKARIISGEQKVPATAAELNALFPGKYNLPAVN
jgi:basic membrane protein A